jgi:hypothetical protein
MSKNGKFKHKKNKFAQVSNVAIRDKNLSLRAKGLYSLIQSYITIEGFTLYKKMLNNQSIEGRDSFNKAWNELKDNGYLIVTESRCNGAFCYEYELVDEPENHRILDSRSRLNRTPETSTLNKSLPSDTVQSNTLLISNAENADSWVFDVFTDCFESYFGYKHRKINKIPNVAEMEEMDIDDLEECFKDYFRKYGTGIKKQDLEKCSINRVSASFNRYASGGLYSW